MGLQIKDNKKYLSIYGDGSLKLKVDENTEGAKSRTTKDGRIVWEKSYSSLSGKIKSVDFYDGEYGKNLQITVEDKEEFVLSVGTGTSFGESLMKVLPNINLKESVEFKPYAIETEDKRRTGVTVYQNGNKLPNYFWDNLAKKPINGYPEPEGDKDSYSKEDWKIYYLKARKFLIGYITENIISKQEQEVPEKKVDYPVDEINPEDIPF